MTVTQSDENLGWSMHAHVGRVIEGHWTINHDAGAGRAVYAANRFRYEMDLVNYGLMPERMNSEQLDLVALLRRL